MELGNENITSLFDFTLNKEVIRTTKFSGGDVLTLEYTGNGAGEFTQMTRPQMRVSLILTGILVTKAMI